METLLEEIRNLIGDYGWQFNVFVIVLLTATIRFFVSLLMKRLTRQIEKTKNLYDDALVEAARRPLGWGVWIVGVSFAAELVARHTDSDLFTYVGTVRDVAVIWLLIWFAVRFIRFVERHVVEDKADSVDETTARAVGKLLRASVLITGVLLVLQAFGISVSGALAFGGIGGIAIGFAARDLLANFFGALMIFMDRPFSVGEWVRSPDREIEGTVEEIGWRLTRIRTFDKRPLYVPNSVFTSLTVENPSRMLNRRIHETVGLRYDDMHTMADVVADVEQMLRDHPDIDDRQTLMVNFVEFGPSSIDFFVYCFTKTTNWVNYHKIKQDVLLQIASTIEKHGADIAYPTRTLKIHAEPDAPGSESPTLSS